MLGSGDGAWGGGHRGSGWRHSPPLPPLPRHESANGGFDAQGPRQLVGPGEKECSAILLGPSGGCGL